ncbi:MAG TPA: PAS domain S-box protein [Sphingobacteriaceae bacterium]
MENLDELLQSINDAVWQMHVPTKKFLYVNQRLADICGIPLSTIQKDPEAYNELIHPADRARVLDKFKKAREGHCIETEYRIITASGIKWIRHKEMLVCDSNNRYEVLVGIFSDITDMLCAQEEVLKSKKNLDALINNTSDLIFSIDRQYQLISANTAFLTRIETFSGVKLRPGDVLLNPNRGSGLMLKWKEYYDRCLRGESYSIIEETNVGSFRSISNVNFNTMYNDRGEVTGVSCFVHDINQHIANQRQILAQNRRLREIAALASHDIRGHVTSILGLLNLFDKNNLCNPENAELLMYLEVASNKLDAVIHKIVDASKEVGQKELC